jgi:D-alanine--D-alanine ligase
MGLKPRFGRIGVLMGGPSSERQISLKSGKAVCEALKKSDVEIIAIDIETDNIKENIRLIKSKKIDCAFIALHGRFGEDGQIQEILETLKIPYTGSGVLASKLAMDKVAARKIFQGNGLSVPRYKEINSSSQAGNLEILNGLNWPLVIKPATHGSSIGLSIIEKEEKFDDALKLAFTYDARIIVEEYIKGREVTVGILDERALPVIEIIPKKLFFDYEAKYQPGMTDYIVPAELEEKISQNLKVAALSSHKLLGCSGCSRVDMILKDDIAYVLEVNTIPGLTSTSLLPKAAKCIGIEFNELCLKLIELAYEKAKIKTKIKA